MKYADVAENVKQLLGNLPSQDEFIFELLLAYGKPKASITRLRQGTYNQSNVPGEVLWKKELYFKAVGLTTEGTKDHRGNALCPSVSSSEAGGEENILYAEIEALKKAKGTKAHNPRFLFVTDFGQILAVDRKTNDTLDIEFRALENHFDFFLPWAGMEKTKLSNENPADVKAAEKMAKLFDAIRQDNPDYLRDDAHAMNVFLARLLFCLFAEDTGIFPENAVTNAIASHTAEDGSDLDAFFKQLFDWLDTPPNERDGTTKHTKDTKKNLRESVSSAVQNSSRLGGFARAIENLPYVNGGLFRDHYDIPVFSAKSRRMLIEAGSLTWAEINPDIFGSMFQAVIDPEERHNLGQHYTSVTNIMKVIEPLFLNDFKEELERAKNLRQQKVRTEALHALHDRMARVKIFDPACGSGNFLIIAYKELRKLEMELFEAMNAFPVSRITVDQFYGIEIDDFACETATLSLWLAEHQMNLEYQKRFKQSLTSLPLKDGAHIVCGNACRIDWETVCPKNKSDEIYVLGNPPYLGSRYQTKQHKEDMKGLIGNGYKNLDYIACWFVKASTYAKVKNADIRFAFVSTNSICQGAQVALLWPRVFECGFEIYFAHQSFKWTNNAKGNAGVICVVIGLRKSSSFAHTIFKDGHAKFVKNINPYLTEGDSIYIARRSFPLSACLNKMVYGALLNDGGNLVLSTEEKDALISEHPASKALIRYYIGASEFLNGKHRWCLKIDNSQIPLAHSIPTIKTRLDKVRQHREKSTEKSTRTIAAQPNKFYFSAHNDHVDAILIPRTSSERREYIPMGFTTGQTVIGDAQAIFNATPFLFGLLSSKMHMAWMRVTCGRLKTDYRYSSALCYNTFPIPNLTEEQKQTITMHVGNVLEERERHSEKTMAQLYDPDKMPAGLRQAHHNLDLAIDRLYRSRPFASDEERLEHLFKLYEEMTQKEQLV
ncbi:MAG: class I SAM-dependent DNA methyltransferase [Pontiellaceae bacterium]|nr:class I SAM-dependent DNA methyltransferase [Pontiellaceae bacterium]